MVQVTTFPKDLTGPLGDLDAYAKDQLAGGVKTAKKIKWAGRDWVEVVTEMEVAGMVTAARSRVTFVGKSLWNVSVGGAPSFVSGKQAEAFFASAKFAPEK